MNPDIPIYIPTKSRAHNCMTPRFLDTIDVPYRLVVEENQYEEYNKYFSSEKIIILDPAYKKTFDPLMELKEGQSTGSGPARNFLWDHSISEGHEWHWTMDDNIRYFVRLDKNRKTPVGDGTIFKAMEDFTFRYEKIAMSGPQYSWFMPSRQKFKPFVTGSRIYSCNLIRNDIPFRWRGRYNEDTILALDVLKGGWQTIQFYTFLQEKAETQSMTGGNMEAFYAEEGTYAKSQMLVDTHPDVARLAVRYGRMHHHVDYKRWLNKPIKRKPAYELPENNPYLKNRVITVETSAADYEANYKSVKGNNKNA